MNDLVVSYTKSAPPEVTTKMYWLYEKVAWAFRGETRLDASNVVYEPESVNEPVPWFRFWDKL